MTCSEKLFNNNFILTESSAQMNNEEGNNVRPPPKMGGPPDLFACPDPRSPVENNHPSSPVPRNRILLTYKTSIIIGQKKGFTTLKQSDPKHRVLTIKLYNDIYASLRWPSLPPLSPPAKRPPHNC